jgi:hypothetical protein
MNLIKHLPQDLQEDIEYQFLHSIWMSRVIHMMEIYPDIGREELLWRAIVFLIKLDKKNFEKILELSSLRPSRLEVSPGGD